MIVTRGRHRQAFEETIAALDRALSHRASGGEELIAEELRSAATTLGRLTGRVDVEDILDVIFRDFCIGNEWLKIMVNEERTSASTLCFT